MESTLSSFQNVMDDLYDCFTYRHVWLTLSSYEIRARYRRTVLGPLWLSLGTAITVLGMGVVWAGIFHISVTEFLPYVAAGMVIWGLIACILNESCSIFIAQYGIIHNVKFSYFLHSMTMISRNLIVFMHNMLVVLATFLLCGQHISPVIVLFIPGVLLLILNSVWVSVLLGIFGTRYRDLPSIVGSVVTLCMLITPIMWKPEMLQGRSHYVVSLNPVAHLLEVMRAPLLGQVPSFHNYAVCICLFIVGTSFSLWIYKKYAHRIVFWM